MRPFCILVGILGMMGVFISSGQSQVVVNEIMYHTQSDVDSGEYIELLNTASQAIDLSGWKLSDAVDFVFPSGTQIAATGFLVVCRDELTLRNLYKMDSTINTVGNYAPTNLSNAGERIVLEDAQGNEIDRVSYHDTPPWPQEADGLGASLELVNPMVDNNNVLYWKASTAPTPGKPNSRYVADIPPRLLAIHRSPQAPTDKDLVLVEILFAEADSLQTVNLNWMINGGSPKIQAMTRNGNRFTMEFPAQPNGTVVEYWLTATNKSGYTVISPPGGSERFYLYRVENSPIAAGSVVINEIMYNNPTAAGEDKEWVELYNLSASPIDLSYWMLKDEEDDHVFRLPQGTGISQYGYLLIAREKDSTWTTPTVTGLPFSLGDNGDAVRLFDPNGKLINGAAYNDSSEWPKGADGEGGSLELLQASRPNNEPNNWAVSYRGGTPGQANARAIFDTAYHDYDIVINEIYYHPPQEEYDNNIQTEYVELYNRNAQPVDLGGWYFSNGIEFLFPAGTAIPGNGYLLVCKDISRYPNVSNKIGNFTLQLNNGGETIALTNKNGVVIDYVNYNDKSPWPILPDGEGNSLELISPYADNRIPEFWRSGQPSSPGQTNSVLVANLPPRITNVTHTPNHPTAQEASSGGDKIETTEIIKAGDIWRYFKGKKEPPTNWKALDFDDTSWLQGPSGFGYGDNDDATVLSDMQNNYLSIYIRKTFTIDDLTGYTGLTFGITYDDGFVAYLNGVEVARENVNGNPPAYNQTSGPSIEPTEFTVDLSKQISLLKKGKNVLSIQVHNISLSSSDLSAIPALALTRKISTGGDQQAGADTIQITANVTDADGIAEVKLLYQRLSAPLGAGLVLGDWKTIPMLDDGTHGDAVAGDSVFAVILNDAETIKPLEVWRYKISAKDRLGNEFTLPYADEFTRNYAFYVADRANIPKYPTIFLLTERAVLDWLVRNPDSNQEQRCIVVIDGDVYDLYNAGGIRYRGQGMRDKPEKSWRIAFAKGNRWRDRRVINLDANYQTSPLLRGESGFLEHLAYQMFQTMNVPAANTDHWRLDINNNYYGLFIMVEQYNEDFLQEHQLPDETRIFQTGIQGNRSYMALEPDLASYTQKYENNIGKAEDIADLVKFIEGLNTATDVKSFFETQVNLDFFLDYLACIAVVSQVDNAEQNYYPVHGADGRWWIMPWDLSHSWGENPSNNNFPLLSNTSLLDGAEGGIYGINILRQKFLRVPEFRKLYYERLRDYTDHLFTREHLDPIFDAYWTYLQAAISENTTRWNSPGRLAEMVGEMKKYVTSRRDFILSDPNVRPATIPAKPVNTSPTDGQPLASRTIVLEAKLGDGTHSVSQWELQKASADFYQPLWIGIQNTGKIESINVPPDAVASGAQFFWRMRYQDQAGIWSDWSTPTSFTLQNLLSPPDVREVAATPLDGAVRIEWAKPTASDLIRVDIYEGNTLVESTPIADNRVRIDNLTNGIEYIFTIRTVSVDRQVSPGVTVKARPIGPLSNNEIIAYFRFEGDGLDSGGFYTSGTLLGSAEITTPGAEDPIPLTQNPNLYSLNLQGLDGSGFRFGNQEPYLNVKNQLTIECYAQLANASQNPMILVDRYDEANAAVDGVWRFGVNISAAGSLDFCFNDGDSTMGYLSRLQVAADAGAALADHQFHHYAAVMDLTASKMADKVRLYIDGKKATTQIVNDDGVSDYDRFRTDSLLPVYVGAKRTANGTAQVWNGRIDEVRFTAGALEPKAFLHPESDQPGVEDWMMY